MGILIMDGGLILYFVTVNNMGTGIGINCRCCGNQLTYDDGFDRDAELCDKCKNEIIPMVIKYLASRGQEMYR